MPHLCVNGSTSRARVIKVLLLLAEKRRANGNGEMSHQSCLPAGENQRTAAKVGGE